MPIIGTDQIPEIIAPSDQVGSLETLVETQETQETQEIDLETDHETQETALTREVDLTGVDQGPLTVPVEEITEGTIEGIEADSDREEDVLIRAPSIATQELRQRRLTKIRDVVSHVTTMAIGNRTVINTMKMAQERTVIIPSLKPIEMIWNS